MKRLLSHRDLDVYQGAAALRKEPFVLSLQFPNDERFELRSQCRRSSRSVCAAIAEAWRKRHYEAMWVNKLSDAEQEAGETQIWIETAEECAYISAELSASLIDRYEKVIAQLTIMTLQKNKWVVQR